MTNLKVSIVIPTYNSMAYLPEAIASVQKQSFQAFEILVIDDGSTDDTEKWVSSLTDSRLRLISQENQGCAVARNNGIRASKGQYIAFLDADDIWESGKLEEQASILDSFPNVGLVNTWISNIDIEGNSLGSFGTPNAEGRVWETVIEVNPIMCGSAPMIRRQCFDQVGLFDQNLRSAEDWDMWIRIAKMYEFAVVKKPLVRYRIHPNRKSHNIELHLQSRLKVVEKVFRDKTSNISLAKDKIYGLIYLSIAYRALQNHDCDRAFTLKKQSFKHYPRLFYQKAFHRLGLILFLRRRLGDNQYEQILKTLKYVARPSLIGVVGPTFSVFDKSLEANNDSPQR